jgi:hypothetical protein
VSNAFGLLSFDWDAALPDEERDAILGKITAAVRKWRLEVPMILFLESSAPLAGIAGQGLVAFSPFAAPLLAGGIQSVQKMHKLLEQPENVQRLIQLLSETDLTETETNAARK